MKNKFIKLFDKHRKTINKTRRKAQKTFDNKEIV